MEKLEEKDFIRGDKTNASDVLLISEDCNEYIDSVIDQIYALNLTIEDEKQYGIEIHRQKYDDGWKTVKFYFGAGNTIYFSKNDSKYRNETYRTIRELTYNGQYFDADVMGLLSSFGLVASQTIFSYRDDWEDLNFNEGIEKKTDIIDGKNLTQYQKLGIRKTPKFSQKFGRYSYRYLDRDSYKTEYSKDGNYDTLYFDLEGKPLEQEELIATSFDTFDNSFNSFNNKLNSCRELVDNKIQEIISKKQTI